MTLCNQLGCKGLVIAHPLGVQPIIILADGQIQRSVNLSAMHVCLHLGIVHGLGKLDAYLQYIVKRFLGMSLELGNMTFSRRSRYARLNNSVNTAADMAPKIHPCLPTFGRVNLNPDSLEVGNDSRLLIMTTPKQAQGTTFETLNDCPTK